MVGTQNLVEFRHYNHSGLGNKMVGLGLRWKKNIMLWVKMSFVMLRKLHNVTYVMKS